MKPRTFAYPMVAVALLAMSPSLLQAWGNEGHETVAIIAARLMAPKTKGAIMQIVRTATQDGLRLAQLLGTNPTQRTFEEVMAKMATWPDHMPGGKKETQPWHFVDVGLFEDATPAVLTKRCPNEDCVSKKLEVLADNLRARRTLTRFSVEQELRFFIHFWGDIHQPLHAVTDADAGGNCVHVRGFTERELHAVWDTSLVELLHDNSGGDLVSEILAAESGVPALANLRKQGAPEVVAHESFTVAKTFVYPHARPSIPTIPDFPKFFEVTPSQCDEQAPDAINRVVVNGRTSYGDETTKDLVRRQLFLAGARLADALDAIFGR